MNLPYRYRGLSLVGLLALLLPWAAWHFALSDTFGAWRECGRLEDVFLPYDKQMDVKAQEVTGFQIKEHAITFLGVCPQCAAEKETA